jgi:hypothetical protein
MFRFVEGFVGLEFCLEAIVQYGKGRTKCDDLLV